MNVWGDFYIPNWTFITTVIFVGLYIYYTWNFNYWKSQNIIVATRPIPFLGSAWIFFFKTIHEADMEYLKTRKEKAFGLYEVRNPVLIVQDLDMIKEVTIKSFHNFMDRRRFPVSSKDRITKYFLTIMEGETWKTHRSVLSPLFTSGKLRQVCGLMEECGDQLVSAIKERLPLEKDDMDMKTKFSAYAMNVIATCCFGLKINTQDPDDPFVKHGKLLFEPNLVVLGFIMMFMPKFIEIFDLSIFSSTCLKYYSKVVNKVVGMRKQENIRRNDFLQLLLDAQQRDAKEDSSNEISNDVVEKDVFDIGSELNTTKKSSLSGKQVLTEEALASHVTLFLLAGFETTSSNMAFAAYFLALNPEYQEKLLQEIDEELEKHGKLTYEVIMEMKYLDMVISETLRYFPPAVRLERRCVRDCELGGIKLKKETVICIPTYAIHHNEEYYPNPEKFDPERFTPENKAKRNPLTYAPFGIGPRNCLGMRFALQEVKIGLAYFFSEFRVSPSVKTEIPIKFKKGLALLLPINGVHLKVERRK